MNKRLNIGWSNFALSRHKPEGGFSYFKGTNAQLLSLVRKHWSKRVPGAGRSDLSKVVIVPVPADKFVGNTVKIRDGLSIKAQIKRRQPGEDPFVSTSTDRFYWTNTKRSTDVRDPLSRRMSRIAPMEKIKYAKVILYSKDALLENNGKRSGDYDWEVVALIASPVKDEPMHPLAMARNFLQKKGGTYAPYHEGKTPEQVARFFCKAIYFWSQRVTISPKTSTDEG